MRNTFLIATVLFCLATAVLATDQKNDARQQPQPTEQTQMAHNDAGESMDHLASAKTECPPKNKKHSQRKQQDDPEGDPQASQNQVEYGGGG